MAVRSDQLAMPAIECGRRRTNGGALRLALLVAFWKPQAWLHHSSELLCRVPHAACQVDTGIRDLTSSHFWFYPTQSASWILSRVFLQKTPEFPPHWLQWQ